MKQGIDEKALPEPEVMIDESAVAARTAELGNELTEFFREKKLTVVAISNGAMIFVADLIRHIQLPLQLDSISAHSYRGTESSGTLTVLSELKLNMKGRDILLVDDILDTGRTLKEISAFLETLNPSSVRTCVLLDKPSRRIADIEADFKGFTVEDVFVVGYGLDFDEYYRNLPYIGRLA